MLLLQQPDNSHLVFTTVVAIVAALIVAGFLESKILAHLNWTTPERAVGLVAATNMITPVLAFIYLVAAFLVFSFFGIESYTNFQEQGFLKIVIYLLFPILIIVLRKQMLKILQIKTGAAAWFYSFAATKITFWLIAMFIYFFIEFFKK